MTGVLKSLAASMMALMVEKEEQLKAGNAICKIKLIKLNFPYSHYSQSNPVLQESPYMCSENYLIVQKHVSDQKLNLIT
jgi:hypothetical protein